MSSGASKRDVAEDVALRERVARRIPRVIDRHVLSSWAHERSPHERSPMTLTRGRAPRGRRVRPSRTTSRAGPAAPGDSDPPPEPDRLAEPGVEPGRRRMAERPA